MAFVQTRIFRDSRCHDDIITDPVRGPLETMILAILAKKLALGLTARIRILFIPYSNHRTNNKRTIKSKQQPDAILSSYTTCHLIILDKVICYTKFLQKTKLLRVANFYRELMFNVCLVHT